HGAVLEHASLVRREPVEAGGDERMERLRHVELLDGSRRTVNGALLRQQAAVEQHAHGLDGVERHALGTGEDLASKRARQSGYETGEQLLHRLFGERLEE